MHPACARDVAGAGFTGIETFSNDVVVPYSHEAGGADPGQRRGGGFVGQRGRASF